MIIIKRKYTKYFNHIDNNLLFLIELELTATLLYLGTGGAATGFARQANNDDMVYIVQQKDGKFRVLGNDMYQTDTTFDQKLGGAATDEMGTTFTVTVTDVCPAPFYIGEIVTADGIINTAV